MFLDFLLGRKKESEADVPEAKLTIEEEARSLLASRSAISSEIDTIGTESFENALLLHREALELASDFEEVLGRKEKAEFGAFATKVKFARRVKKSSKDLARFAARVISLFEQGKLREEDGKVFGKVHELLSAGKAREATAVAGKLRGLLELEARRQESEKRIAEFKGRLLRELAGIGHSLEKIGEYEALGEVDEEATARYSGIRQKLGEYGNWRAERIRQLKTMPLISLISDPDLSQLGFPMLEGAQELREFMEKEPALSRLSAEALLEMNSWRDEKLSHIVPEVSKFRRLVRENSKCLWKIRELEKTGFLAAQYAEKAHAYAARHGAPGAEALLEVAKLGEEGLEKLRREQEKLERLNGLRELAKPEEKEKLLARKSEIERAISLF